MILCITGNFTCKCSADYEGQRCENRINDCASSPCYHNGICMDRIAAYSCVCAMPFTGVQCEARIKECLFKPCKNNATCIEGTGIETYRCICLAGLTGEGYA